MSQDNSMGKFICSLNGKDAWYLSAEEVENQTFGTKEEAIQWFKEQHEGKEVQLRGYRDVNNTVHRVKIDGQSIGKIDEYPT